MPPEEEAFASKACGNKYKYCKKIVCRCPKQQKTTQRDQYHNYVEEELRCVTECKILIYSAKLKPFKSNMVCSPSFSLMHIIYNHKVDVSQSFKEYFFIYI